MTDKLAHLKRHTNGKAVVKRDPAESKLQAKCVEDLHNWYKEYRGRLFAITNNSVDAFKGAYNKALGVIDGVSDTCWIGEGGTVVWIEFKRPGRGNGQSTNQKEWQAMVEELGHTYIVCNSYKHFWEIVNLPNPNPEFTLF